MTRPDLPLCSLDNASHFGQSGRVSDAAIDRLVEHASGLDVAGFADAVWQLRTAGTPPDLAAVWAELAQLLQTLADTEVVRPDRGIPLKLAYAIAEMQCTAVTLAMDARTETERNERDLFAWRLACGWQALLAGDVQDIGLHVADEELARRA